MKLVLSIAAFAFLMAARDAVDGIVPRILLGAAAGVALAFALTDVRARRTDAPKPKDPGSHTPGSPGRPRGLVVPRCSLWGGLLFFKALCTSRRCTAD